MIPAFWCMIIGKCHFNFKVLNAFFNFPKNFSVFIIGGKDLNGNFVEGTWVTTFDIIPDQVYFKAQVQIENLKE